jgi:hypothetical protein
MGLDRQSRLAKHEANCHVSAWYVGETVKLLSSTGCMSFHSQLNRSNFVARGCKHDGAVY